MGGSQRSGIVACGGWKRRMKKTRKVLSLGCGHGEGGKWCRVLRRADLEHSFYSRRYQVLPFAYQSKRSIRICLLNAAHRSRTREVGWQSAVVWTLQVALGHH